MHTVVRMCLVALPEGNLALPPEDDPTQPFARGCHSAGRRMVDCLDNSLVTVET